MQPGDKVRVKPGAWSTFLAEEKLSDRPAPGLRTIIDMPSHPPFHDRVMLDWPFHWWKEEDLEFVE